MDSSDMGLKDYLIVGSIMGLLKIISMRMANYLESDLTWWESYGIWTVLSLITIAIHAGFRRIFMSRSIRNDTTPCGQAVPQIEDLEAKS
jgi:hypothetical protein